MGDLKEGRATECLPEVGAQAGKGLAIEEDIALFSGDILHSTRIAQTQSLSAFQEGAVDII